MSEALRKFLQIETKHLDQAGLLRAELKLQAPPGPTVTIGDRELINLCSSDYLGLSNHPQVKQAARAALDSFGVALASPRIVTGTVALHAELERALSDFLGTEDTLVFASGYHATTGLFESLVSERDYLFCDAQVQPSVADGIRLCRAKVFPYRSRDLNDLEDRLRRSRSARFRLIVTDGIFPLEGATAPLEEICKLAERYEAMVVVEDGQALGVLGPHGKGTPGLLRVASRVDLVSGSFSHALGGTGGFASGRKEVITWLRQKSRPYLSSSALTPAAAAAALKALEMASGQPRLRTQLRGKLELFKNALQEERLTLVGSDHPTVSVMLRDAVTTQKIADLLYRKGVFAMGFCHPVVPEGSARIRAQVTVSHTDEALQKAAGIFGECARALRRRV
jgi:glycine C-acetyltransferase